MSPRLVAIGLAVALLLSAVPHHAAIAAAGDQTADATKVASLSAGIVAGVRKVVADNPTADPATLQALVEKVLEQQLAAAQPTAAQATAALAAAEATLKAAGEFTPPVEAAFVTARTAVAALTDIAPAAGEGAGNAPLGAPPAVSGGGGTQTATYAPPQ